MVFEVLWDKWKTQNDLFYSRYAALWVLEIAVDGWLLSSIPGGVDFGEEVLMITLLSLTTVVDIYLRRLMRIDLIVRNTYNLQIVWALIERGIYERPSNYEELRSSWSPDNFRHKINNWHCISTEDWKRNSRTEVGQGTLSIMRVIVLICVFHIICIFVLAALAVR